MWGYCYTQLTDVEQEQNGIYCYDRSAKFDMDRIKAIFSKRPEHPPDNAPDSRPPDEAHPENPERDFGVRFIRFVIVRPRQSLVRECARKQKASLNFYSRAFRI